VTLLLWLAALAGATPLLVDEVMRAVDERVPQLAAAEAKLVQAESKLLAARGAFDPVLVAKGGVYAGKDPREVASAALVAPSVAGPLLELGYDVGRGEFPPYDGDRATPPGGEVWVRGVLPLLDGLGMPQERAQLLVARAGTALAEADLADKRLEVRRKAAEAYWKWVASGGKLRIEQDLLDQAEVRAAALAREVAQGTRARLDLLDNQRVVLQRRDAVARAGWDLGLAALALSLWYRDAQGAPEVPDVDELPPFVVAPVALPPAEADRRAAASRPDVAAVDALMAAARAEVARADNALLPDLALVGEVIRPVDPDAKPELYAGAEVKLPTLMRKERGSLGAARAGLEGLEQARRGTVDAAVAEAVGARLGIDAAAERVAWTSEAQALAQEVVELERRRFEVGGGDIFQLLAREGNLASAQKAAVEAALDHQLAVAARAAAVGLLP
jgi:outer membrane protein TolC